MPFDVAILEDYPEVVGVHPYAEFFPMMAQEELDGLADSITEAGLEYPIIVDTEGLLLDGRNRLTAAAKLGIPIQVERWDGHDKLNYIIGLNVARRHLTPVQKAFVGAHIKGELQREGTASNQYSEANGSAAERAAKLAGCSKTYVNKAYTVLAYNDLKEAVEVGELSLDEAYHLAVERNTPPPATPVTPPVDSSPSGATSPAAGTEGQPTQPESAEEPSSTQNMLVLLTDKGDEVLYPEPQRVTFNQQTDKEIGWAMQSWNPVTGCRHTCSYCYARSLAESASFKKIYPVGFTPLFHHERLAAPANTPVPAKASEDSAYKRVFVCSMADLFGSWVPQEWIDQVIAVTVANPQWEYLFLTKYPQRYHRLALPSTGWIGASIDSQEKVEPTLKTLREVSGVKVKWLSLEPLLEPIHFNSLKGIDWIVIGAQSANPGQNESYAPNFDWVMELVTTARYHGTKVWLKHNLLGKVDGNLPGMILPNELP